MALLRSWTSDLVVLANGEPADDLDGVPVDRRPVASVAPGLVRFAGGGELEVDALHVIATGSLAATGLHRSLVFPG